MKFEIYNTTKSEKQPPVLLQLRESPIGVEVVVVDREGVIVTAGHLLTFTEKGRVRMQTGVNMGLGFVLNGIGEIEVQ